ncbi:hypothetical protein ACOMHN_014269 [Nucella lapillus]
MKRCVLEIPLVVVVVILDVLVLQTPSQEVPLGLITSGRDFLLACPFHETALPDVPILQLLLLSNPSPLYDANVTVSAPLNNETIGLLASGDDTYSVLVPPASSLFLDIDVDMMVTSDRVEDKGIHVISDAVEGLLVSGDDTHTAIVPPTGSRFLDIDLAVMVTSDQVEDKGIQVISDQDIMVQMLSGANSKLRRSSGGTLIYPSSTLQTEYWVAHRCPDIQCYISIVGAEAGQTMVVAGVRTESPQHSIQFLGQQYLDGEVIVYSVQQFQVMQLLCGSSDCSISGTTIVTSRPVAIFVGAVQGKFNSLSDTYFEQIPPLPLTVGGPENSLSSFTYLVAPLRDGNATEEVKVVAHKRGTTVSLSTGDTFTSADYYEVHTFNFSGEDMGIVNVTASDRVTLIQLTDGGYLPSKGKIVGDASSLIPLPTVFWTSSCLLALPEADEDILTAFGWNMELTIVIGSWEEDCLHSEDTEILNKLLTAVSESSLKDEVGRPAVVRVPLKWGSTAVISSRCGPVSAHLFGYGSHHGWTMALAGLNWMEQSASHHKAYTARYLRACYNHRKATTYSASCDRTNTAIRPFNHNSCSTFAANEEKKPLSVQDAQRQIVEESIREEVRNTLSVDTTSLSSNRRSKLSEGDLTIAYGVGLAGTVLVIAQLLWSAYQVRKYGIKGKQDENLSKKGERPREGEGNKTRQRKHENDPPAERT